MEDIVFNVTGQSLYLDVPEGVPSSVTSINVYRFNSGDDSTAESATTGSPSIDSASTVVDANSGASQTDPTLLYVNSTTNFTIGRTYLAINSQDQKEYFELTAIDSDNYLKARDPLSLDYVVGNSVQGCRISISVDSTWVADANKISGDTDPNEGYRARFEYVASGSSYVRYSYFDLVRSKGQHSVKPTDIENLIPGFTKMLPHHHRDDKGASLIDEAYQQVKIDLYQEEIPDELVRNEELINELVKRKAVLLWAEARALTSDASLESVEVARTTYQARWDNLVRAKVQLPVDVTNSGASSRISRLGLSVR